MAHKSGNGNVNNCYNMGNVKCSDTNSGGIVGVNGNVASGTVTTCYNIGKIEGPRYVGGIVGLSGYNGGTGKASNSYYLTGTASYGIGSTSSNTNAQPKSSDVMKTVDFVNLLGNANWKLVSGKNNGYPILMWESDN